MKINWKVRFKNGPFLVALFSAALLLVQQIGSLFGVDTTLYSEQATNIFNAVLYVLIILGVVVDPVTDGLSDSERALNKK